MSTTVSGGWIGVAGAVMFFVGAAIATSVGVWNLSGSDLLDGVSRAASLWRWGNVLLAVGSATSGVGMVLVASESSTLAARLGAILWLVAGASGLVGFIVQGEGTLRAASEWGNTRATPSSVELLRITTGVAIGVFVAGGILGSAALGWYMHSARGLSKELVTSGATVLVVALIFAAIRIPAAAALLAGWVAVARLLQES